MVIIGEKLERSLTKGERVTRVCLDTVLEQVSSYLLLTTNQEDTCLLHPNPNP